MESPPFMMVLIVSGVIMVASFSIYYVVSLAAQGKVGPNGAAGIRLTPLLSSEKAWEAGHSAAVKVAKRQLAIVAILTLLTIVVSAHPWLYLIGLSVTIACLIFYTVMCVVRAVRAANFVNSEGYEFK